MARRRENPRREAFARLVAAGLPLVDAYERAGYTRNYQAASRAAKMVDVAAMIRLFSGETVPDATPEAVAAATKDAGRSAYHLDRATGKLVEKHFELGPAYEGFLAAALRRLTALVETVPADTAADVQRLAAAITSVAQDMRVHGGGVASRDASAVMVNHVINDEEAAAKRLMVEYRPKPADNSPRDAGLAS